MTPEPSPFHAGELYVQRRAGAQREAQINGRIITPEVPPGARPFITAQQLAVLATRDAHGRPWVSIMFGEPGFVQVLDAQHVALSLPDLRTDPADSCWVNTATPEARVGLLLLEPRTRRRFRLNGVVASRSATEIVLEIHQAFPNCPKYIQRRTAQQLPAVEVVEPRSFVTLDPEYQQLIERADTFFVGSTNDAGDVDASHRGGQPGFVRVLDKTTLLIPDYPGNGMFNTLGNFVSQPFAGLLFLDFSSGRMLQLTGTATVRWDAPDAEAATGGTGRCWQFQLQAGQELRGLRGGAWSTPEYSPFNP